MAEAVKKEEVKSKRPIVNSKSYLRTRRADGNPEYFCKAWDFDLGRWNINIELCHFSWYDRAGQD